MSRAEIMSGERTLLACWRTRPRDCELFLDVGGEGRTGMQEKFVSAERPNQHAKRVRSPDLRNLASLFVGSFVFRQGCACPAVAGLRADSPKLRSQWRRVFD